MKNSVVILCLVLCALFVCRTADADRKPHFTLWQLPPASERTNLSYVIRTSHQRLLVVDGGSPGDAGYLESFIKKHGGEVDSWFITHPHDDHAGALTEILKKPGHLKIGRIYGCFPTEEWVGKYEVVALPTIAAFYKAVAQSGIPIVRPKLGDNLDFDGVRVEILGVDNPEIDEEDPVNSSSVVFRMSDSKKSVLFLGDLGQKGGDKLLAGPFGKKLKSDYVQMSHHGNIGVNENVYQAIHPKYCLWPTTWWVWDNNNGTGVNTADMHTFEVREWMYKLGVKKNYLAFRGLFRVD